MRMGKKNIVTDNWYLIDKFASYVALPVFRTICIFYDEFSLCQIYNLSKTKISETVSLIWILRRS